MVEMRIFETQETKDTFPTVIPTSLEYELHTTTSYYINFSQLFIHDCDCNGILTESLVEPHC